jgi:hypothetical protein
LLLAPLLKCVHTRFADQGKQVVLQGLGDNGNSSSSGAGDQVGILYDDGSRDHDDRYAGDGLYSNMVFIKFKKTGQAVYKEFYVSLLQQIVSSTVEIAGGRERACSCLLPLAVLRLSSLPRCQG